MEWRAAGRHFRCLYDKIKDKYFASLRGTDEEALHDLRVSLRRFRAALRFFRPLLPTSSSSLDLAIADIFRVTGPFRDLQVWRTFLLDQLQQKPTDYRLKKVLESLRSDTRFHRTALNRVLDRAEHRSVLKKLADFLPSASGPQPCSSEILLLQQFAAKRFRRKLHQWKTRQAVGLKSGTKTIHRARKRIRWVRYYNELRGEICADSEKRFTSLLRELSDTLGIWHDLAQHQQRLLMPENRIIRPIQGDVRKEKKKIRQRYLALWKKLQTQSYRKSAGVRYQSMDMPPKSPA